MSMTYEQFLSLFPKSPREKAGKGVRVLCPAHDDRNPSLWVEPPSGDSFTVDFKCLAGCKGEAILDALKLTWADVRKDGGKLAHIEWRVTDSFVYELEAGKEYYIVDRLENSNEKKFVAKHKSNGDYVFNMRGLTPILYKLPELRQAVASSKTILLPEGEGKVNRLRELGFEATTNPFGAGKWNSSYTKEFAGADVVILPDYDKPGLDFTEHKARALHGTAKRVCVVQLTELEMLKKSTGKDGVDIINWLDAGHTKEELKAHIDSAPEYKPKESDISLVCIAEVAPETVSWLWFPYIPFGKLTLLEGDPGIGKSWVSLAITTAASTGKGLPGAEAIDSASVVLASAEDGLGDTIRPRLDAMGADVRNVHAIKGALDFGNGGLVILEGYIEQVQPSLVIIDPLVAYIGAGVDIHRANETRAVMARLADIAEKHGCAILTVRHLTKGGTLKPIYRGLGSIDFAAACRSVLMAGCDPDNPQKRGIVQIKSNLAPMGKAIGFELTDGGFYWTGESDLTWQRILSAEDTDGKSAIDEAADFLRDELRDGPVEAKQVFSDAKSLGIYERTLNRAKSKLRITSKREGESGKRGIARVKWQLPEDLEGQKDLGCQDCLIEDIGNVNQISLNNSVTPLGAGNVNTPDVLGMPVEKVIELWHREGRPVIHMGPGENCERLDLLLSNHNVKPEHLLAVKVWLEKLKQGSD